VSFELTFRLPGQVLHAHLLPHPYATLPQRLRQQANDTIRPGPPQDPDIPQRAGPLRASGTYRLGLYIGKTKSSHPERGPNRVRYAANRHKIFPAVRVPKIGKWLGFREPSGARRCRLAAHGRGAGARAEQREKVHV
jgi:hypothetical protein